MLAPAKTPAAVIAALNRAVALAVDTPEMKTKMAGVMAEALPSTPERLQGLIRADIEKWTRVAQSANIKSE